MAWIAGQILSAAARMPQSEVAGADLEAAAGLSPAQVSNSCRVLVKLGFLERRAPGVFRLTEAGRAAIAEGAKIASGSKAARPRERTRGLRKQAWAAMRMGHKFTLESLMELACDGGEADAYANLKKYVSALLKAGYLALLRKAPGASRHSNGLNRYLLVKDTGPKAPVWRARSGEIFDPNTNEIVKLPAAAREAA
jgi:DNA-binding MarR family transcriptional regulator